MVAAILVVAAVGGRGASSGVAHASPAPCAPGAALIAQHAAGSLRGDVTGDGRRERVVLALDARGHARCRFFVLLRLAAGTLRAPLDDPYLDRETRPVGETGTPVLKSLVEIDGERGLEIVVEVHRGASTGLVGVFTIESGRLTRMRIRPHVRDDLFAYAGSLAGVSAVGCVRMVGGAWIASSSVAPRGRRWVGERRLYRVRDAAFELVPARTRRVRWAIARRAPFPEWRHGPARPPGHRYGSRLGPHPFGSCPSPRR